MGSCPDTDIDPVEPVVSFLTVTASLCAASLPRKRCNAKSEVDS